MEIEKSVLIVLRTLNLIAKQRDRAKNKKYIEFLSTSLTPNQKQTFLEMAKAMILLTGGNVATVRDPQKFDVSMADPWFEMMGTRLVRIMMQIVPSFDTGKIPTREDYELANDILPLLGASSLVADEINQLAPNLSPEEKEASEISGYETLYRGLSNLSFNIIRFIITKPNWETERPGVSTSYDKQESARFAAIETEQGFLASANGPSIFFKINNPNRKGFIADRLSAFSREKEVIVSGVLKVDSWNIHLRGLMVNYTDEEERTYDETLNTNVKINSENKTVSFYSYDNFDEEVQFDSEEKFIKYVSDLIERRDPSLSIPLQNLNKTYKWVPTEYSTLALVNATLQ
jgi:hypothetical protein